jgi:transcriptional regulator with XRE-family HTH domain
MTEHRLKDVIKSKGLKMTYLAEKLEIPQPTLSLYLSGKRKMPTEVEFKLAKELA